MTVTGPSPATDTPGVPLSLAEALRVVVVRPEDLTASVAGTEINEESRRKLRQRLAEQLYRHLHSGTKAEAPASTVHDVEFEEALACAVPHDSTCRQAMVVDRAPEPPTMTVRLEDLRVVLPAHQVFPATGDRAMVHIPSRRPSLSPGYFLVDGSPGSGLEPKGSCLRLYVHLWHANSAPEIWGLALSVLESHGFAYRAKVLSRRTAYPRRDGLVVYLGPRSWSAVRLLTDTIDGHPGLGDDCSVFTEPLGTGIAAAWEPDDNRPGMRGLSFGQHRALAVASALLEQQAFRDVFAEFNIDPDSPAHNLTSPPILTLGAR